MRNALQTRLIFKGSSFEGLGSLVQMKASPDTVISEQAQPFCFCVSQTSYPALRIGTPPRLNANCCICCSLKNTASEQLPVQDPEIFYKNQVWNFELNLLIYRTGLYFHGFHTLHNLGGNHVISLYRLYDLKFRKISAQNVVLFSGVKVNLYHIVTFFQFRGRRHILQPFTTSCPLY